MAKRARHEGSIYRQKTDGRWVAAVSVGYRNGRRSRKKFFGATRREVAAKLTQALHDQQHGLPVAPRIAVGGTEPASRTFCESVLTRVEICSENTGPRCGFPIPFPPAGGDRWHERVALSACPPERTEPPQGRAFARTDHDEEVRPGSRMARTRTP